jgi:hypothetical protein
MLRLRFPLAFLMALVALAAVGLAALHAPSLLWASTLFTLAWGSVGIAALAAIAIPGRVRVASIGFASFSAAYLIATFLLWPQLNGVVPPPLLPAFALDALREAQERGAFVGGWMARPSRSEAR